MIYKFFIYLIFYQSLIHFLFSQSHYVLEHEGGYKIASGDSIDLTVLNEDECRVSTKVDPDGSIRLVYLGMVKLSGLTIQQAEQKVSSLYIERKIFRKPTIIAKITSYTPRFVYISGSVNKQGPFVLPAEAAAVSITELINMSGGLNPVANKSKISVTRSFRDNDGKLLKTKVFIINLDALSAGNTEVEGQKWWVYPGDQINVPERLF